MAARLLATRTGQRSADAPSAGKSAPLISVHATLCAAMRAADQRDVDVGSVMHRGRRLQADPRDRCHLRQARDRGIHVGRARNRRARQRESLRVEDAHVVAAVVQQIGERGDEPARQQQHVEEQRPDDGHANRRQCRSCPIAAHRAPGQPRRRHRPTSDRMSRRSSVHDAAMPAATPRGTASANERSAIERVTRRNTSVVS